MSATRDYPGSSGKTGEEDEEILAECAGATEEDDMFDTMIGALQEIILDDYFVQLQTTFCEEHSEEFEDTEENKLSYTAIFEQYIETIEDYLETKMKQKVPGFSMATLCDLIQEREDEVSEDIVHILTSCGNFEEFKTLMLSHKQNSSVDLTVNVEAASEAPNNTDRD